MTETKERTFLKNTINSAEMMVDEKCKLIEEHYSDKYYALIWVCIIIVVLLGGLCSDLYSQIHTNLLIHIIK